MSEILTATISKSVLQVEIFTDDVNLEGFYDISSPYLPFSLKKIFTLILVAPSADVPPPVLDATLPAVPPPAFLNCKITYVSGKIQDQPCCDTF